MEKKINIFEPYTDEKEREAVLRVLDSGWFIGGKETEAFENEFKDYIGVKYAVACSNGTAAILLALEALGIKENDEVIVPSHTVFPTIEPILNIKAKPVFVDVNEETYTLNIEEAKKKMNEKTKAVIAVHLYGHPAELDSLKEICKEKNIYLIEDCAQSVGAEYKSMKVGSIGDIGCFSFYPSKNMTVCGDGGMVVTNNPEIREKIFMLKNHGMKTRYENVLLGFNFRISEMACALGREQLRKLDGFNEKRRKIAEWYGKYMPENLILPCEKEYAKHVYHLYVIRSKERDKLKEFLEKNNIKSEIHYPIPGHLQPVMPENFKITLPVTEKIVKEILSLPIHVKLSEEDVKFVCGKIREFYGKI